MTKDVDAIEGILDSIEDLALTGANILKDGKVDMNDIPAAVGLLSQVSSIIENFKKAGEAFKEAKDLNAEEAIAVVGKLYEVGKKIEEALRKEEA